MTWKIALRAREHGWREAAIDLFLASAWAVSVMVQKKAQEKEPDPINYFFRAVF